VEGLKRLVRRLMEGAVVPGLSSARVVRSWSPTDFPVLTLRNFVDERRYGDRVDELRARRAAIRARWDLPEGSLVLLTPARLIHAKGLDMALQAIQGRRGVFLVMAGNGPERQRLEGMIVRMGLTNARLVPSADEPDLLELYAAADALLLPSRRETYGLVAIEALWARLPVLLSSGAGVFEDALEVGTNGWAIDPDCPMSVREAVDHAIETGPDGLREMGQHSRALAEERYRSNEAASTFVQQLLDAFPP
jgi:glycosyltransferase involved in cell wall biosynthesis